MKRRFPRLVIALPLAALALLGSSFARADLAGDVRRAVQNKAVKAERLGIEIIRLGNGANGGDAQTVFQHNARLPLGPASNLKLVTTAAALELLGPDFRFRTMLAVRGAPGGAHDVAIVGDGDPTLGDAEMLQKLGWGVDTVFANWADVLKKRGVTRVRNVYVDDSVFDEVFLHPNWPPEQQHKRYVAQVGGVNLNANCVDFFLQTGAHGEYVTYATDPVTSYVSVST